MKLSVIVMSCDNYADLWSPFAKNFEKYWPACPYPVYLVSETLVSNSEIFSETILCGKGKEWTERLEIAINQVDTDFTILLCEDYLLCDFVSTAKIEELLVFAQINNIGNLRMLPNPKPGRLLDIDPNFSVYEKGSQYRIATQAGIWKKSYLKQLTIVKSSIWGFERMGSEFSNKLDEQVLCTTKHFFPFIDAIHKGHWETNAIALCERNEIQIDFSSRKSMTNLLYLKKYGKGAIFNLAPNRITKIMNAISKLKAVILGSTTKIREATYDFKE
jgi:hypothetical protein